MANFTAWVFWYGCFVLADVLAACSVIFSEDDGLDRREDDRNGLDRCSVIFSEGDGLDRAA